MPGRLVISLDFELMWGVHDKRTLDDYGDAVLNVRQVIPEILSRFSRFGIRATWATVGLLFCRSRDEMRDRAPQHKPEYKNLRLSPYVALENEVGRNEGEDPYHFGRTLIDRISETEGQEIATHTFSHFCCLEDGHSPEAFNADLAVARSVAYDAGHKVRSIVFPRNQFAAEHLEICGKQGLTCYRGNPDNFAYRPRKGDDTTLMMRATRLIDSVLPVSQRSSFIPEPNVSALANIRSSRFLRPFAARTPVFSQMHLERVKREMRVAALQDEVYHLWWHPHNMGRQLDRNLSQLDAVLAEFRRLQDTYGFVSANMHDLSIPASITLGTDSLESRK